VKCVDQQNFLTVFNNNVNKYSCCGCTIKEALSTVVDSQWVLWSTEPHILKLHPAYCRFVENTCCCHILLFNGSISQCIQIFIQNVITGGEFCQL